MPARNEPGTAMPTSAAERSAERRDDHDHDQQDREIRTLFCRSVSMLAMSSELSWSS